MGVDLARVRQNYHEATCHAYDNSEWIGKEAARQRVMADVPDLLAELAASRQRIAELEKALASREAAIATAEAQLRIAIRQRDAAYGYGSDGGEPPWLK